MSLVRTRETDYIVVHSADTFANMDIGRKEIDEWHKARGWKGIGYHKVIRRDGTVEDGRPVDHIGAHVEGFNNVSVGICLVGGKGVDGRAEANFSPAQWASLISVLTDLSTKYRRAKIVGHRDLDRKKQCPGFDVGAWWEGV